MHMSAFSKEDWGAKGEIIPAMRNTFVEEVYLQLLASPRPGNAELMAFAKSEVGKMGSQPHFAAAVPLLKYA